MSRIVAFVIWANVAVLVALAFIYPHLMISPGPLIEGHAELEQSCFSCHTPFFGASDPNCIACHKVKDIGILTTKGLAVTKQTAAGNFHQKLASADCVACHSDHRGLAVYRTTRRSISHDLLPADALAQCVGCHGKQTPKDELHEGSSQRCKNCHETTHWKPAKRDRQHYLDLLRLRKGTIGGSGSGNGGAGGGGNVPWWQQQGGGWEGDD